MINSSTAAVTVFAPFNEVGRLHAEASCLRSNSLHKHAQAFDNTTLASLQSSGVGLDALLNLTTVTSGAYTVAASLTYSQCKQVKHALLLLGSA